MTYEGPTDTLPTIYSHYVCFHCRKSFAPAVTRDHKHCSIGLPAPESRPCPDCGQPLVGLGLAFKPPKQSDKRTWRQLQARALQGDRFLRP